MNSSAPEFERLDQAALIVLGRHHQHIDRAPAGGDQPCFPAQLDTGHMFKLGAGDQRFDIRIDLDLVKCVALIGEGKDLVTTRCKHAGDDQSSRATGIDQSDAHASLPLSRYFKALPDGP